MNEFAIEKVLDELTGKDDKSACALADKIATESEQSCYWYAYFKDFALLLSHPKSLVRNRALSILASNAKWDVENKFDLILSEFLSHVTDEKPITSRQCIKAIALVGKAKPQYAKRIVAYLREADLSKYKDSMRPLIEKDIAQAISALNHLI